MFDKILKNIDLIENNKESVIDSWMNYKVVQDTLKKHNLNIRFYRENFATKVFNYALGVVKSQNNFGECPVISVMLIIFKKKNIPLSDVFIICVHLKNAFLCFANQNKKLDNEMINEISKLMDFNFKGVIDDYVALYYQDRRRIDSKVNTETITQNTPEHVNTEVDKKSLSAATYLEEVDISYEIIAELDELESDTLDAIEAEEFITQNALIDSAELFERYSKVLNNMYDFEELSYTLIILSKLLSQSECSKMSNEVQGYIQIYLKAIISDLSSWRKSIFINKSAKDIHYLDKTLLSSIAQLQITLIPNDNSSEEEIEFF